MNRQRAAKGANAMMKILLLDPHDKLGDPSTKGHWDLVVDLAHTPISTRERWRRDTGYSLLSLYDFGQETADLHATRQLLEAGMGRVVDHAGTDWWDVVSIMISPELQDLMLVRRLAEHLKQPSELYTTRYNRLAYALQVMLGGTLRVFDSRRIASARRRFQHYSKALSQLDATQLVQVAWDKFDSRSTIRRWLSPPPRRSDQPVVLLPSAYVNVSRIAVSYAALLAEQQFLLVFARKSGALQDLPKNVRTMPLSSYFVKRNRHEEKSLLETWERTRQELIVGFVEFKAAATTGILDAVPGLIRWGIAVRDAWSRVLKLENVVACLSADDSNPYTRIPLILARQRGIPALACHHGAFDAAMAYKQPHFDAYLAKSEMERDYLVRVCHLDPEKVVVGAPGKSLMVTSAHGNNNSSELFLVWFTEPYPTDWRGEDLFADLLPRLSALADACGLRLVVKVHPFESIKQYRRLLARCLPSEDCRRVEVLAGPLPGRMWERTRFAVAGESSVAIECTGRGIPIFLCGWMRDARLGYTQQYAKFRVGTIVNYPSDLDQIPQLLAGATISGEIREQLLAPIDREMFRTLLAGRGRQPVPANGRGNSWQS
jgi:hypothetical protein